MWRLVPIQNSLANEQAFYGNSVASSNTAPLLYCWEPGIPELYLIAPPSASYFPLLQGKVEVRLRQGHYKPCRVLFIVSEAIVCVELVSDSLLILSVRDSSLQHHVIGPVAMVTKNACMHKVYRNPSLRDFAWPLQPRHIKPDCFVSISPASGTLPLALTTLSAGAAGFCLPVLL